MSLRSASKPSISSPSRPPAGKSNSLRTGSQKISGPAAHPKTQSNSVRSKSGATPKIKTPVRSSVVISN